MTFLATVSLLGSTEGLHCTSNIAPEPFPFVQNSLPKALTSEKSLSQEVSVLKPKFFVSYSSLIKAAKIFAGVFVVTVATAAVVVLCLKFLPVLIVALAIAGVICMVKQSKSADDTRRNKAAIDEIAQVVIGEKIEEGEFESDEFPSMANEKNGLSGAFSSYISGDQNAGIIGSHPYPYTIVGVGSDPKKIFKHFAQRALNESDLEKVELILEDANNPEQQKRARHVCAFLKLLGNLNIATDRQIALDINRINEYVSPWYQPLKAGTLEIDFKNAGDQPLSFSVKDEEIALSQVQKGGKQELNFVARFKTSRTVTVFPPDQEGKVSYTITRTFKRI